MMKHFPGSGNNQEISLHHFGPPSHIIDWKPLFTTTTSKNGSNVQGLSKLVNFLPSISYITFTDCFGREASDQLLVWSRLQRQSQTTFSMAAEEQNHHQKQENDRWFVFILYSSNIYLVEPPTPMPIFERNIQRGETQLTLNRKQSKNSYESR